METNHAFSTRYALLACLLVIAGVGCSRASSGVAGSGQALTAECLSADAGAPGAGAWVCPQEFSVECSAQDDTTLYVPDELGSGCEGETLSVSNAGPFAAGEHNIVVRDGQGDELCSAELTVTDTQAPVTTPSAIKLWPPNHKFHAIAVQDCVRAQDACEGELQGEFIWASSDEPIDDLGDGHHAPDILIDDCQRVQVRAERQGPKDGRVYKLGVRFVDGSGNAVEDECTIIVDHDQRGVTGVDSSEAYRIELDGTAGAPECDGIVPGEPEDMDAGSGTPADAGTGGAPAPSTPDAGDDEPQPVPLSDAGSPS